MKKVLYFFPDDLGNQNAGNITRALHLLGYFKHRQFEVDFAGLQAEGDAKAGQNNDAVTRFLRNHNQARQVFLLPRKPGKENMVTYFLKYKIRDLLYYWLHYPLRSGIPTFMTVALMKAFDRILAAHTYDYIIISYVYYADLIANRSLLHGAKTIADTHDFITAQFKNKRGFNLGITFEDEIARLNKFDQVWAISPEEQYVFSQFCKNEVKLVPLMMDAPAKEDSAAKEFDLIYVASDNVHNIKAARWFFQEVYPLLPAGVTMCVIGKINHHIADHQRVKRVPYAPELDTWYNNSKLAICPMFSGTGVKVKVVEALSYGVPVVCTHYGTAGLPDKTDNGCSVSDDPQEFARLITRLLADPLLYEQQSLAGKRLFNENFNVAAGYAILDKLFEN